MAWQAELAGLPVALSGPPHVVTQVAAFVEATLGWQVTEGDTLPARVRLVAVQTAPDEGGSQGRVPGRGRVHRTSRVLPVVALVGPDDDPVVAARLARSAEAVVAWPSGHDDLADAVVAVLGASVEHATARDSVVHVAGSAGGVGTTTIALALGAWLAWDDTPTLVVTPAAVPVPDVRVVQPDVVAGHRGWAAAAEVGDVPGLRVVGCAGPVERVAAPHGVHVVVDGGVVGHGDAAVAAPHVVVVRRDRAGCAAVADHPGAVVVAVDLGPRPRRDLVAAAGGREVVVVPASGRAVRAHERQAVPGSLPRAVLDPIREVLVRLDDSADPARGMAVPDGGPPGPQLSTWGSIRGRWSTRRS